MVVGPYIHAFIASLPLPTTYINLGVLLAHIHPEWTRRRKQYRFQNVV
jgi:hypothetical protein